MRIIYNERSAGDIRSFTLKMRDGDTMTRHLYNSPKTDTIDEKLDEFTSNKYSTFYTLYFYLV